MRKLVALFVAKPDAVPNTPMKRSMMPVLEDEGPVVRV
jgi:hypothetical protein